MQAIQAPPRLPGISAATPFLVNIIFPGSLAVLLGVPTITLGIVDARNTGGHLPWPIVQWALTTPAGVLATLAVIILIMFPPFLVGQRYNLRRWSLARAVDVTEVPPWVWLSRPPVRPGETVADRWLGRGRKAHITSLSLVASAGAIFLLFVAGYIASAVLSFAQIPSALCAPRGCPPIYPLLPMLLASEFALIGFSSLIQYRWLRRVEESSGVWLRLRNWFAARDVLYLRRPGVSPEAASAALARFAPAESMPMARVFAIAVLAALPLLVIFIVGLFAQFWLPTQWIPG